MEYMSDLFSPDLTQYIILPALIAGVAISICAALLGTTLVLRHYSMLGDGLSHVGYGALCVATVMNCTPLVVAIPVVVLAAILMLHLSESGRLKGDHVISMFATTAMAIGIMISSKAGLTNDVSHYMFGSMLALSSSDVIFCVVTAVFVSLSYYLLYHRIFSITFDSDFAKATGISVKVYHMIIAVLIAGTVVMGMMLMGTLLISCLTVMPTLSAMRLTSNFKGITICALLISIVCFLLGFLMAIVMDFTPGASVVVVNMLCYLVCSCIAKRREGA